MEVFRLNSWVSSHYYITSINRKYEVPTYLLGYPFNASSCCCWRLSYLTYLIWFDMN